MTRSVHVLLIEGYADWEPALALAEIARGSALPVVSVGFSRAPLRSMGRLTVTPDLALSEVDPVESAMVIVPGGDRWTEGDYPRAEVEHLLRAALAAGAPVAAACGATVALARGGLFAGRRHTSNDRAWLGSVVPGYAGHELYEEELVVTDDNLITASGVAPVEWANAILTALSVYPEAQRRIWFKLMKTGRLAPEEAAVLFGQA